MDNGCRFERFGVVLGHLGIWVMLKPPSATQSTESLQEILMDHIAYQTEVHRAHEKYAAQLHGDTCAILIYRYSHGTCSPCYL